MREVFPIGAIVPQSRAPISTRTSVGRKCFLMLLVILFSESVAQLIRLLFASLSIVSFHGLLLVVKLYAILTIKVALVAFLKTELRQSTCERGQKSHSTCLDIVRPPRSVLSNECGQSTHVSTIT